jgi:uncharacterized protein YhbP (UPF0306 family)
MEVPKMQLHRAMTVNKPLKFVPATKGVAATGLANARRLAGRYASQRKRNFRCLKSRLSV